jgi:HlyD family secretion protein
MKTNYLFLIFAITLTACSGRKELSDAYGTFEVDDVMISAEASGKLLFFNAEQGKRVAKGELMAVIDTTDLVLKRDQLIAQQKTTSSRIDNVQSQIEVQKQQLANFMTDKNRIEKLLKDGAATQKQLDDINGQIELVNRQIGSTNTQYSTVRTELEVYNAQIAQLNESIRKSSIYNPLEGIILEKYAEQNEITAFGKPLYKIADMAEMILRVYVSGEQLPHIRLSQEVEVLIDQDKKTNRKLSGIISWVSETAEFTPKIIQTKEERVNMVYAVKVSVKNNGSLKIGMPGEVNF